MHAKARERPERTGNMLHALCHNNYVLSVLPFDYVSNISCEDYILVPLLWMIMRFVQPSLLYESLI